MKQPEYEKMPVPRISNDVKRMNGQSTRKLQQCLEALGDLLDEDNEAQHEEGTDSPISPSNAE